MGSFGGGSAIPSRAEGARLIALPMGNASFANLRDDVKATAALDSIRLRLLGLPVNLSAYASLLGTLGVGGYVDADLRKVGYGRDHFTCFQFQRLDRPLRADEQYLPVRTAIPWTSTTFLQRNHLGLTKAPTFSDNMLYHLLLEPKR